MVGDVLLEEQHARRRAALARGIECGPHGVAHHLLGERAAVGDHGIDAAGLGDERDERAAPVGERRLDRPSGRVRAGKGDAGDARILGQHRADRPVTRHKLQHLAGDARRVHQLDGKEGRDRRLLGGFGDHGVAGRERGGDLPDEDREREIPRRDAAEHAAPAQGQRIALAGRAGQRDGPRELAPRLVGVVAQEIDGLAHLRERGVERLAGLADDHAHQPRAIPLQPIGGLVEKDSPHLTAETIPTLGGLAGTDDRALDLLGRCFQHDAEPAPAIVRAQHQSRRIAAADRLAVDDRADCEIRRDLGVDLAQQPRAG